MLFKEYIGVYSLGSTPLLFVPYLFLHFLYCRGQGDDEHSYYYNTSTSIAKRATELKIIR